MPDQVTEIAPLDAPPAALTHEIKYVMPAASAGPAEAWLNAVCRPERAYPPAWVCSVYFDRLDGTLLDEKINSDYDKTKLRVRWYAPLAGEAAGAAFLEVKRRTGTSREKHRIVLAEPAAEIASWPIVDPRWLRLLAPAAGLVSGPLRAVLAGAADGRPEPRASVALPPLRRRGGYALSGGAGRWAPSSG